jgi:hypothetical protein
MTTSTGYYSGPAQIIDDNGHVIDSVRVHLSSIPPSSERLGSWKGTLAIAGHDDKDAVRLDVGPITIRLRSGRVGRAIVKSVSLDPRRSAELIGSGPPPF